MTDQILALFHGILFPWAGTSARITRAVVDFLTWPVRTVAAGAKERIVLDELAREERRAQ